LFVLIGAAVAMGAMPSDEVLAEEKFPIKPHAETQELIAQWMSTADEGDPLPRAKALGRLQVLAAADHQRFVEQVAFYAAHMKEKIYAPVVYRLFGYCLISNDTWAKVMSRYAYCDNQQLRKDARNILRGATPGGGYQNYCDLGLFDTLVHDDHEEISSPAKRWIFETSPNSAYLLLARDARNNEFIRLRRLERVISNALFEIQYMGGLEGGKISKEIEDAVRELAKSPHWWARLFVAETIVQNREFRVADVIATLAKDPDPLVKQSIASLEKEDPLRATRVDTGRLLRLPVVP